MRQTERTYPPNFELALTFFLFFASQVTISAIVLDKGDSPASNSSTRVFFDVVLRDNASAIVVSNSLGLASVGAFVNTTRQSLQSFGYVIEATLVNATSGLYRAAFPTLLNNIAGISPIVVTRDRDGAVFKYMPRTVAGNATTFNQSDQVSVLVPAFDSTNITVVSPARQYPQVELRFTNDTVSCRLVKGFCSPTCNVSYAAVGDCTMTTAPVCLAVGE